MKKIAAALAPHSVLITLIAVLVVAEIVVRTSWLSTLQPHSLSEQIYVETGLKRSSHPQVIFIGNSRIRVGISPQIISEILNVPTVNVSNIAYDNGKPHSFLQVYIEHRSRLQDARILVIGVDAKMFNKAFPSEEQSVAIAAENSSLPSRLNPTPWADRLNLTLGKYWKTWEKRPLFGQHVKHWLRARALGRGPYVDDLGRVMLMQQADTHPTEGDFLDRQDFTNFLFDEEELQALHQLVRLAHTDDTRVVLVDAPLGPVYRTMVETQFSKEDTYWRHRIRETTGLTVEILPLSSPVCRDWKKCFEDNGHLNYSGAQGYSQDMGRWLKLRYPHLWRGWYQAHSHSGLDSGPDSERN